MRTELVLVQDSSILRPGITSPLPKPTRYALTSNPSVWLHAPRGGFVGAVHDSIEDGRDRIVLAWPSRPENGFLSAAIALREARATGKLAHATVGLWPWREGAEYAARSVLVNPEDIARVAARAVSEVRESAGWVDPRLDHFALCMLELRLNDLLPSTSETRDRHKSADATTNTTPEGDVPVVRSPTLLETTLAFAPVFVDKNPSYMRNADQVLHRVRRHTHIKCKGSTMETYLSAVGDPQLAPFAIMGLAPATRSELTVCLRHERFAAHGLDAVVVDLTRMARSVLGLDWESRLSVLLSALDTVHLHRRPPVVILCEDACAIRRANATLRAHISAQKNGRRFPLLQGVLLMHPGTLEAPGASAPPLDLSPIAFEADIKDASLVPLRDRLLNLARSLREAGRNDEAAAVRTGLRFLGFCASLPIGCDEAKEIASDLFAGDSIEDQALRSAFYPFSVLEPMATAERSAAEFSGDIRELRGAIISRINNWKAATPVSTKLTKLLMAPEWNAQDVLLVLPDLRTAEVFKSSRSGETCSCTVVATGQLAERIANHTWRRIMLVKPEPNAVRALLTMPSATEHVLLLCDAASASLFFAELEPLQSLSAFAPFAKRAAALAAALERGGASEALDLIDLDYRYNIAASEGLIDLAQSTDAYKGDVVCLHVNAGLRIIYRTTSDVILLTPDEIRPFKKIHANKVTVGDSILVLRKELRDKLSEVLVHSRSTANELKVYHEHIRRYCARLPEKTLRAKAHRVLHAMRAIDPSLGDHELPNIVRWLSVEPSEIHQQPRAPRDKHRFSTFMTVLGINDPLKDAFWNFAIVPSRIYSVQEGHLFNRQVVQFVLDPEGFAIGAGRHEYEDLWHAVTDSVDVVIQKEIVPWLSLRS